ncbi:MAG: hypothetical protein B7X59_06150 [Polaromonas sp. 39-63-203]|jgi:phytoene synthase|nr:MAG: hypothetical protein B7Y54_06680 [Polaromonas sp. 35-63-240]OYY97627.1 MAG: hypothetical protein B7Y42_07985 [Polaromonas sp. 28-63-22]OYZ83810.1 MAG: hypothetical protein B7Y03_07180 [Polaromonas sp. 24-62-144]OZA98433.1 MAG: hypothetical protein B7X59_06150 [Polaromonas sp. 39-63-203]
MNTTILEQPLVQFVDPDQVLKSKGRSFHWARRLLGSEHSARATRLYSMCRYLDDLADESLSIEQSRSTLANIKCSILDGQSDHPVIRDGLSLIQECNIDPGVLCELIDGVALDLDHVAIAELDDLLRYCYQVAGTVGLMMCSVLDVEESAAWPHAVDLGIAMQLTNICRDVKADAQAGRRYLPASMVGNLSAIELVDPSSDLRPQLQDCLQRLLEIADCYYSSGELGLSYLPLRARAGILTAARLYRAIGTSIKNCQYQYWRGRVVVNGFKKTALTAKLLLGAPVSHAFWRPTYQHDQTLHRPLENMIRVNRSSNVYHGL